MGNVFDFKLEPGLELKENNYMNYFPLVSVIVPFYNDYDYMRQTIYSLLNQTFPYFEILIIDDGSSDEKKICILDELAKIDNRIKVFHKKNEGLAATRDYGVKMSSTTSKYFLFNDSDDLLNETFLECAFFALETNLEAGWSYSDSVGFDANEYLWKKWFDSNKLKKVNDLLALALVRKEAYYAVNGYELREKAVNEDWNFWLKLISKGYYPVHMSFFGEWYRRKKIGSELAKSISNKKRTMKIINKTIKSIKSNVEGIQYPRFVYNNDLVENFHNLEIPVKKDSKKVNILMFIPWMVTGGADFFNLELLKRLDKDYYNVIVITSVPSINSLRQEFEKYSIVYDLTSFLDRKYWLAFVNYIIQKEKINFFFCTNSMFGYSLLPYLKNKYSDIPVVDYVHMEEWYYRNGGYARMSSVYKDFIDKTLVCNKGTEGVLVQRFGKEKEEVETVYIGVDVDKFNPSLYNKTDLLKKYGLVDNSKYVISYICRISAQKRPLLLLEIIKKNVKVRQDVLFLIVGDGDLLPILQKEIKRLNLEEYVKFLGNIKETAEIYSISDITINCSIKEGLALTAYESLAMNVPVISADVGGQKELIDEKVGCIVPCLQEETEINEFNYSSKEVDSYVRAIDVVLSNLNKLKCNCRKKILNDFTLDKMSIRMMNVFEEVVNRKKLNGSKILEEEQFNYIKDEFNYDVSSNYYLIREYQKKSYGYFCIDMEGVVIYNYKKELFREKLWEMSIWRKFVASRYYKCLVDCYRKLRK